jgi:hypothetical protein
MCSAVLYGAGGSGGPMGMIYYADFAPLNQYMEPYNIPDFDNQIPMWGGTGTNWLTQGLGIGGMVVGGFQMKFNGDRYGALYLISGGLLIQNIVYDSKTIRVTGVFAPGITSLFFVLNSSTERSEFLLGSMVFLLGITTEIKITHGTKLEFGAGYNIVSKESWEKLSGPESATLPENTPISGLCISMAVKFGGGSPTTTQGGVYVPTPVPTTGY